MLSNFESFIHAIQKIILEESNNKILESYYASHLWQYSIELFTEHKEMIESILSLGYSPDNIFLRETLSGNYPIIRMNEVDKFEESFNSGKSDLVPSVTFVKVLENKNLQYPIVRIDFGNSGIAGID